MITIAVGVITRNRPKFFINLLRSFEQMVHPLDARVIFVLVENNDRLTIADTVESFSKRIGHQAVVGLQPTLGIARARNTVLDLARQHGAGYLAFVDDDEQVMEDWLVQLWTRLRDGRFDLVSGPVRPVAAQGDRLGYSASLVLDGLGWLAQREDLRNTARSQEDHNSSIAAATNNWLCSLAFLQAHDLRFDESLGFAGGEDADLSDRLRSKGGRAGWASDAVVHETIPLSRLSLWYQVSRHRDQALVSYGSGDRPVALEALRILPFAISKGVVGTLRVTIAFLTRGGGMVSGLRCWGLVLGRAMALFGAKSQHYRVIHGA